MRKQHIFLSYGEQKGNFILQELNIFRIAAGNGGVKLAKQGLEQSSLDNLPDREKDFRTRESGLFSIAYAESGTIRNCRSVSTSAA
jgi:hypothetical protein